MKSAFGVILLVVALYLPFWVGAELLPDGWADSPLAHWWTIPMVVTLPAIAIGIGVYAVTLIVSEK